MSAADPAVPRRSWLARVWGFIVELWDVLRRPSSVFGLGVLVLAGFVAGVVFWGGFNTALELTNTEKFCTGCHEMRDNVFAELKSTIHFTNRSVRARAVPIATSAQVVDRQDRAQDASLQGGLGPSIRHHRHKENSSTIGSSCATRMGTLQGQRLPGMPQLPQHRSMDIPSSRRASVAHQRFLFTAEKTCIDCHKGIAHKLPDMRGVPGWQ
jgi:cytochrome c-type protein NapC